MPHHFAIWSVHFFTLVFMVFIAHACKEDGKKLAV
jgi:hypothetical protein